MNLKRAEKLPKIDVEEEAVQSWPTYGSDESNVSDEESPRPPRGLLPINSILVLALVIVLGAIIVMVALQGSHREMSAEPAKNSTQPAQPPQPSTDDSLDEDWLALADSQMGTGRYSLAIDSLSHVKDVAKRDGGLIEVADGAAGTGSYQWAVDATEGVDSTELRDQRYRQIAASASNVGAYSWATTALCKVSTASC